mmetsp:Transcript_18747/g.41091  ORF Transcript_18747/g.41091 Transcript_18747/m.41091 type:complete len:455 (+) Transcript_18747:85-1449(+)
MAGAVENLAEVETAPEEVHLAGGDLACSSTAASESIGTAATGEARGSANDALGVGSADGAAPAVAGGSITSGALASSSTSLEAPAQGLSSEARAQQLLQRVAHLEADLTLLRQRKGQLELENEVLAAKAAQQADLEVRLAEAQQQNSRLEAECRRHRAESARRAELELQQAEIARSFTELQGVVSQLVQRLGELDTQRARLVEEKGAAEASAASLRAELQKWRTLKQAVAAAGGHAHFHSHSHGRNDSRSCSPYLARPRLERPMRRLRCRADLTPPCRSQGSRTATPTLHGSSGSLRGAAVTTAAMMRGGSVTAARTRSRDVAPASAFELAQAKADNEILRHRLTSEEEARAKAVESREAVLLESTCVAARTSELQSELRQMLSTWSARSEEEAPLGSPGSAGGNATGAETASSGGCASPGGAASTSGAGSKLQQAPVASASPAAASPQSTSAA